MPMFRTTQRSIKAVLAAALLLLAGAAARAAVPVGSAAPALVVASLDGTPIDLAALRGKVVIVHWWATWCPQCRQEMPALDAFYRAHRDRGLELIAVSIDRKRDLKDVLRVMKPFAFAAAMVGEAKVNGWGSPEVMPITYVIDAAGVVREEVLPGKGALTEGRLAEIVTPLLPAAPPNAAPGARP